MSNFKVFICQMLVGQDKSKNVEKAVSAIRLAASNKAHLVVLPECFNSPYGTKYFKEYAEEVSLEGKTCGAISRAAKENGVYVVAGSIPERCGDRYYNTCVIFDNKGQIVDKYRKMHLFKIDLPEIRFDESEVLTRGDRPVTFDLAFGDRTVKIGMMICFDLRFPELAQQYREMGVDIIICPGAFNMKTGPMHWRLLGQARAVDAQLFTVLVSPARNEQSEYVAYGHSFVADPLGKTLLELGAGESAQFAELDLDRVQQVRDQIPVGSSRALLELPRLPENLTLKDLVALYGKN